mmetsp:Transcript_15979/g.32349  ORF Transcript_15979/g.32349 Transcript_15979/m.32349 type:complete len:80 (-) Transcript_15979:271-510(-)
MRNQNIAMRHPKKGRRGVISKRTMQVRRRSVGHLSRVFGYLVWRFRLGALQLDSEFLLLGNVSTQNGELLTRTKVLITN